ncbi:LuxR C-terminal-related transcriptional regulator [Pseudomonas indica]|uniref:LuxR C-terminal-related transcriptional regulator n=1 Tax=Pseudomonas indica TaxID=137658 RepID=UPI0023F67C72|nr:response regulator transcription factor [Pseudomonas indica]MBU3059292.1 response regulator transcription factor [Pseudomonas indica]
MHERTVKDRIIVADDHPVFRDGLKRIVLKQFPGAQVQEAGCMEEVLACARASEEPPDTFVLDLLFPGLDSTRSIGELRQEFRSSSIVIVSMVDDAALIQDIMAAGADGFIGKSVSPDEIGAALTAVRNGEFVVKFSPSGLVPARHEPPAPLEPLTPRQRDVLRLVADGLSNKEIARKLEISPFTVRIHVSSLLRALNVGTRSALAAKAAKAGL